jgi:hypothetical protein
MNRATGSSINCSSAGDGGRPVTVLGVDYHHAKQDDGGDLYVTRYGLACVECLQPENWFDPAWFRAKRQRLLGTSTICKMPTKPVDGRSLDLVVRYSRMGERVPVDTDTLCRNVNSEFNSPFEEVSLVMELRAGQFGPPALRIHTKKPLAIYVPAERLALWQTGRFEDKFAARQARHPDFRLDLECQYIVIYGWIDGHDAEQMADLQGMTGGKRSDFLEAITRRAELELDLKGFRVVDMKPAHVILRRRPGGRLLRWRDGRLAYAVVDYELLERTAAHEAWRRRAGAPSYAVPSSAPSLSAGALSPKS